MNGFEYALGLFSVLIGLALADIAMSAHKLVRHFRTIRWDIRVILSSLLVVVVIVRMWFAFWTIRNVGAVLNFPFYLSLFIELMILFLLASSCLPDEPTEDYDLATFYEGNQRSLWTVFIAFELSFLLHWFYFGGWGMPARKIILAFVPLTTCILLLIVRRRWLHIYVPAGLIAWELYRSWNQSLT
jgi:hypothetical protein